jgi:putative DNA primase/helicase
MNNSSSESHALLDGVVAFYRQYLSCSPQQLDLLALWTFHTHCFQVQPFSPALHLHSRHKQSGKSLCLDLLKLLCQHPWRHTSSAPSVLLQQMQGPGEADPFVGTLLLDDCPINNRLQGVLAASFKWYGGQMVVEKDGRGGFRINSYQAFFPKAFAANRRLPPALADLAIPLALEPKPPGSFCHRFRYQEAFEQTLPLLKRLYQWGAENAGPLEQIAPYKEDQFPPQLSARQQDCAEPLLQIADLIGGAWPQRARQALVNAFAWSAFEDFYASRQLLSDLRDAFAAQDNPAWISTADLLGFLHILDDRTWDEWSKGKPLSASDLARLLEPFGIRSHNHRTGSTSVAKGYNLQDFKKSWELHLPQPCSTAAPGCGRSDVAAASPESINNEIPNPTRSGVAADSNHEPCSTAAPGCGGSDIAAESPESINHEIPDPACSGVAADSHHEPCCTPPPAVEVAT